MIGLMLALVAGDPCVINGGVNTGTVVQSCSSVQTTECRDACFTTAVQSIQMPPVHLPPEALKDPSTFCAGLTFAARIDGSFTRNALMWTRADWAFVVTADNAVLRCPYQGAPQLILNKPAA